MSELIEAYGGSLVNLYVPVEGLDELKEQAGRLPSLQLSDRSVCDLELLANGAFSPLNRFMGREDHDRVVSELRLDNGSIFPIPIALPVGADVNITLDEKIALRDSKNDLLAVMTVEEIYEWDIEAVAQNVFGTLDVRHPLVAEMHRWGKLNISGPLQVLKVPNQCDFKDLRLTPAQTRARLAGFGRSNVVAFQTRNPLHRVHEEL